MSNFSVVNPYTKKIPSGTLTNVQLALPTSVQIAWPNRTGNTVPVQSNKGLSFLRKIFG